MKTISEQWFGEQFTALHPDLQKLHTHGGVLCGDVELSYGAGVASLIGVRLGKKLGLPAKAGPTHLRVEISHTREAMIWSRQFGDSPTTMTSVFTPHGNYNNGFWTESTGLVTVDLSVDVRNGEWHWIQLATRLKTMRIPAMLLPTLAASKFVNDDLYHFKVKLSKRGLGVLVMYKGSLELLPHLNTELL